MCDKLVGKVNAIDASKLVNKTDCNAKIKYIEDKIPTVTKLPTAAALSAVENKISNVSDVIKEKADYDVKISDIATLLLLIIINLWMTYLIQR